MFQDSEGAWLVAVSEDGDSGKIEPSRGVKIETKIGFQNIICDNDFDGSRSAKSESLSAKPMGLSILNTGINSFLPLNTFTEVTTYQLFQF